MSFPVSSEQPAAATAALVAPRTLRNSRRLTPGFFVSWLMSVVAVGTVVARLLALTGRERRGGGRARGRGLLRRVAGGLEPFFRAVAVDVTAHAPTHVERRELIDPVHFLDLAVTRLARNTGIDVSRVREVDVLGKFVNADPGNRFGI